MTTTATVIIPQPPPLPHYSLIQNSNQNGRRLANNSKCHHRSYRQNARNDDHQVDKAGVFKSASADGNSENFGGGGLCLMIPGGGVGKRNWVLSDNFYLLESPKTCRGGKAVKASRLSAAVAGDLSSVGIGLNGNKRVLCKYGGCNDTKLSAAMESEQQQRLSQENQKQPQLQQPPMPKATINAAAIVATGVVGGGFTGSGSSNNLHRSWMNLLDFRDGGGRTDKSKVSRL